MRDLLVSHCTRFFSPFPLITSPPTIAFSFSCPILANEKCYSNAYMPFDRPHSNRVVCPYHAAISYAFDYLGWQVKHSLPIQTKRIGGEHPRAIPPNETNRTTHNLPQRNQPSTRNSLKRNCRGGACVPARTSAQRRFHTKNTRIVRGELTMDAPLWDDAGGHTGTAPTNLHHIFPRNSTQTK